MPTFVKHFHRLNHSQDYATAAPVRAATLAILALGGVLSIFANPCAAMQPAPGQPSPAPTTQPASALPEFKAIESAIAQHFALQSDFQPSDLLFPSQIGAALDAVRDAGWEVSDRQAIVERGLANNSFLAKELSTIAGRKFMRRVARHPGTYGRLDRLSTIAGGQQLIRDLIRQKDGDKLIKYLATTTGGQNMGRMAANTRHGVNLNKPTGRIYTAEELMVALKSSYDLERARRLQIAK